MKNTFFLLLLLIPILGSSQMRERLEFNDLERHQLQGKVKQVIHKEYKPRFSNDSTYTLILDDFFLAPPNYSLEFDQNGYLNTRTELRKDKDSLITGAVWKYEYDSAHRILKERRISHQYTKDTITWNYQYEGDSIIHVQQLDKTYKILYYTYTQKGDLEYLNHANSDSSYMTKKLFVYDKQNRPVRFEDYKDKDHLQYLRISTYNDTLSRNIFKEVTIWAEDNDTFYKEYAHDQFGNPITMSSGNFTGKEPSVNRYEYVYDNEGNWIEKRHINYKGKLSTVFRREIEYYK